VSEQAPLSVREVKDKSYVGGRLRKLLTHKGKSDLVFRIGG
jgi:hypothetical protein